MSVDVEDYSLSQTTLDEVFINFASKQTNNDDSAIDSLPEELPANVGGAPFTDLSVNVAQVVDESRQGGSRFRYPFFLGLINDD